MKKWLIIAGILLLLLTGILLKVYASATKPVRAAEDKAFRIAIEETRMDTAQGFQLYHGDDTYYVVTGKNKSGKEMVVWINEKTGDIITRMADKGISRQDAIDLVSEEKKPQEILDVRLGVIEDRPVWEIYYRSRDHLINYYYLHFDTGEKLRIIENL